MAVDENAVGSQTLMRMVDLGYIAVSRGLFDHAKSIFDAVRMLRPKHDVGFVGGATVCILRGQPDGALQFLEKSPLTPAARLWFGIALIETGEFRRGRDVLSGLRDDLPDLPFGQLAGDILGECVVQ